MIHRNKKLLLVVPIALMVVVITIAIFSCSSGNNSGNTFTDRLDAIESTISNMATNQAEQNVKLNDILEQLESINDKLN